MAYIEEANELMTDATGQSIATAIGNMSATSVGNLAALQTTDKTSLVGAVNEVKSGLIKHHSYTDEIAITTQSGALYRSSLVTIELPDTPTHISVSLKINEGNTIGVIVHSISGKYVNVIVWATESTTIIPTIEFLYT